MGAIKFPLGGTAFWRWGVAPKLSMRFPTPPSPTNLEYQYWYWIVLECSCFSFWPGVYTAARLGLECPVHLHQLVRMWECWEMGVLWV